MTPFVDLPVDGFTLLTSFTFAASMTMERRWLQNDRVNALRQSTMYNFRARVVRPNVNTAMSSYAGQVRATPGSWLWAVSATAGPTVRFWDTAGTSWTQGIPIGGPTAFQSYRNSSVPVYILLDEPWFLADGIINWEEHLNPTPFAFFLDEPRAEIKGEILSACADKRAVEF